jgi:hypothetical protein
MGIRSVRAAGSWSGAVLDGSDYQVADILAIMPIGGGPHLLTNFAAEIEHIGVPRVLRWSTETRLP